MRGLRKAYGGKDAVRGIDLDVRQGEIFAFLGPNGAGKTTTVEILEGFRQRTAGEVRVLGIDPQTATRHWRERIGVVLQESQPEPELTARECVSLYAGYYAQPLPIDATLDAVGMLEQANVRVAALSGGQQRRLDVALALIGDPELLFLDEPTTGFDPSARRAAWAMIAGLRALGKTVLLTTHFMDEAEALADHIAVMAHGTIVAEGTASTLGGRDVSEHRISFTLPVDATEMALPLAVRGAIVDRVGAKMVLQTREPAPLLFALSQWAVERRFELSDIDVRRPSLEDVYLRLTADATEQALHADEAAAT